MGISGGIFLIALGAILAYAVNVDVEVVNLKVAGWVLILAGVAVLVLTVWYWRTSRRRRRPSKPAAEISVLEETRIAHGHAVIDPEQPASHLRTPPEP